MRRAGRICLICIAMLGWAPAYAATGCQVSLGASVDMTIDSSGRITVPLSVDGNRLNMLIDTGGVDTLISRSEAKKLGLQIQNGASGTYMFYGGAFVYEHVRVKNVVLGNLRNDQMNLDVTPGDMPADEDGIIGEKILSSFDIDLDFADDKVNLFHSENCGSEVVYWTNSPVAVIPFSRDRAHHIVFDADLDGKRILALMDTGAAYTVADWETVSDDFDLSDSSPGIVKTRQGKSAVYSFPFKTLRFGGVAVNNPEIKLVPSSVSAMRSGIGPMLIIGANILRKLHIYIATEQNKLYITPVTAH